MSLLLLYKTQDVQVQLPSLTLSIAAQTPQETVIATGGPIQVVLPVLSLSIIAQAPLIDSIEFHAGAPRQKKVRRTKAKAPIDVRIPSLNLNLNVAGVRINVSDNLQIKLPELSLKSLRFAPFCSVEYDELLSPGAMEEEFLTLLANI